MSNEIHLGLSKSFATRAIYRALVMTAKNENLRKIKLEAETFEDGVAFNLGADRDDSWSTFFFDNLEKIERLMFLEALLDEMRDSRVNVEIQDRYLKEANDLLSELYPNSGKEIPE